MTKKISLATRFWRIILWPGKFLKTRTRLSIVQALGVLSLVLLSQAFNLIPSRNDVKMKSRGLQTETLALSGTALATVTRDTAVFRDMLENVVKRDANLVSAGFRNSSGKLRVDVGNHAENWVAPRNGESNDRFMFVPIFRHDEQIGQLELCHKPLMSIAGWFRSDVARLALFIALGSFILFNIILYRFIKQLDPSGAVPRRVREALDNLAEGLLIIDDQDTIMLSNSMFAGLVGIDSDKLIGQNLTDFPWEDRDEIQRLLPWHAAVQLQQPVLDKHMQIVDRDGLLRTFSVSASPVIQGDQCRGVMVTFDDITVLEEHKQELIAARKAADEANEAKSNFLSRMSHEIRTPMNAIIGYTDILRQGDSNQEDQQQYLATIHTSGEHLLTLINDILDLSKIEAGQMSVEHRNCELVPILSNVIETLKMKASERNLYLDLEIEGTIPDRITSDDTRLRQILINTVGNAIKFTSKGGVKLIARMTPGDRGLMQFDVADTGVGIPQHALATIFDPFSQADSTVTRKFGGTGLGLAISKQLSESLGGGIAVRSKQNVGTVFTITINPGELEDVIWLSADDLAAENKKQVEKKKSESRQFERGHILVVDDAEANRGLAGVMLRRLGLTFDMAENGLEAIEQIANHQYDVVLMDINMPVMDGLTATGKLRKAGCQLPIVALTAMVIQEERKRCLDGGCSGFLPKPVRMEALTAMLANYLPLAEGATLPEPPVAVATSPAPASEVNDTVQVNVDADDGGSIESGLAATLASLGIDMSEELADDATLSSNTVDAGPLVVPDVVHSSLPIEDEEMYEIVNGFVNRLRERLPRFRQLWESRDIETLQDQAHWLAGASATVGLDHFVLPAREIEYSDCSNEQRTSDLIHHIEQLNTRIELPSVCE